MPYHIYDPSLEKRKKPVAYWSPEQVTSAVVNGVDLECPYYRKEVTKFCAACQCKLTEAVKPCSGLIVSAGFPCEEGRKALIELDAKIHEFCRAFTGVPENSVKTGMRMRNRA